MVLPPIYFEGGFAVSEAQDHDRNGVARYGCLAKFGKKCYMKYMSIAEAPSEVKALRDQLTMKAAWDQDVFEIKDDGGGNEPGFYYWKPMDDSGKRKLMGPFGTASMAVDDAEGGA